jgi:ABC-2 type transport system ATP-binding protein
MRGAIVANNLEKSYVTKEGGILFKRKKVIKALRGLTFEVRWGEVYGLLGPNGAGKTTAVRIISTLLLPDKGRAIVAGHDVIREPEEVRRKIGVMLSVERGFFWKLTARENLKYFGMLYGLGGKELKERIEEVLDLVGLKEMGATDRRFEDMSLGMKARLGLARALLKDPPVLILDEPTLGLDPPSSRTIRRLLKEQARSGKGVLLTTHNMFEAEAVCDRVGIIFKGRIVAEGTPEELKRRVSDRMGIVLKLRGSLDNITSLKNEVRKRMGLPAGLISSNTNEATLRIVSDPESINRVLNFIINYIVTKGVKIVEWKVEEPTLEDVFIEVTQRSG